MAKSLRIYTIEDTKEEEILRKRSELVTREDLKSSKFREFLEDLLETAKLSDEPAGGISAPQVGVLKRVFYLLNYDTEEWELFINPVVEFIGNRKKSIPEACLSVPHIEKKVERNYKVKVTFWDRNGIKRTRKYEDLNAITIQHEDDHLEGILFIDRIVE